MPQLEIALLGPPEIRLKGVPVKTERRKAIALLAYLAVTGRIQARDHLAGLLWPEYGRDSAYAYLRRTLWELNQILGKGWVEADRESAGLATGSEIWLDTNIFKAITLSQERDIEALMEAAALYRGDFLSGFSVADTAPFESWQYEQVEYFRRQLARALENLAAAQTQAGEPANALPHARRWLALDPLNEQAHRAVMAVLAGLGDRSGIIRQYENCRQTLKDELGIEPQPKTTALYKALLQGDIPAWRPVPEDSTDAPTTSSMETKPAVHLPAMPTPFIGRRPEVERVKLLVKDPSNRLVTLIGPGGSGKTRLSIQAASELGELFPQGMYFASLASVETVDGLIPAIAKALDFSFYQTEEPPRRQLIDYLHEKQLLLILDNFEHLVEASNLVAEMLANAPDLKIIMTSRVRLNVQGEQLFPVSGMRIPTAVETINWDDPEEQAKPYSAVQLFLDRARRVRPDFTLTNQNIQDVMNICQQVQGMPLGLELAAAWLELLDPAEIVVEMARSLDFLATDQIDVPDRQRSIRAVFETSWKLLSREEQNTFLRLCVFAGSFSTEAARQVGEATLKTLLGLANKSWLQSLQDGRFQLHELLRQYGLQRLRDEPESWRNANERHADYYVDFVAEQSNRMRSSEQLEGVKAFADEFHTNIQTAWKWLVARGRWDATMNPMALAFFLYGTIREQLDQMIPLFRDARLSLTFPLDPEERLPWATISTLEVYCEENFAIKDHNPVERLVDVWQMVVEYQLEEAMGIWFVFLASMVQARNLVPGVEDQFKQAMERLRSQDDPWSLGIGLLVRSNSLGQYYFNQEDLLEASRIFKKLGLLYEQGIVAEMLGRIAIQNQQPLPEIIDYFQQAKAFFKQIGADFRSALINFMYLAGQYFREGQPEQGFALHHETQRILEQIGNKRSLAISAQWESLHALRYSTFEHAFEKRQYSLALSKTVEVQSDLAWHQYEMGEIYRVFGQPEKAMDFYERVRLDFEQMNLILGKSYYQRAYGDLALQRGDYNEALQHYLEFFKLATEDNHSWSIQQAHARLALAFAYLGNMPEARAETKTALVEMQSAGEIDLELQALLAESVCRLQEGKLEQATELASFITQHPVSWNETKQQAGEILENAASRMSPVRIQAAISRGKAYRLESLVAEFAISD